MRNALLIICCVISTVSYAQIQKIGGIVTDEFGAPVIGVNIYFSGQKTGTISTDGGKFELKCCNDDTIIFSHIAYETRKLPAITALQAPDPTSIVIVLTGRPVLLETFTLKEKADHRFKYLLDFEIIQQQTITLEILGGDKFLSLYSEQDHLFWKCLLPNYLKKCTRLSKDFLSNVYLQSADSLYQIEADTVVCRILPGIERHQYEFIMEPCIGWLSNGILVKQFGPYQQSISLIIKNRNYRKLVYQQEDVLARMHLNDLDNSGPAPAGLGFKVALPERMKEHPAALSRQPVLKGSGRSASCRGIAKPISVESFCISDTIYIYDHFNNTFSVYNCDGSLIESSTIAFSNREFQQKYILDEANQHLYGVCKNEHGIYLLPIDLRTSRATGTGKPLNLWFYEKVRIVNHTAYYLQFNHIANERKIVRSQL